MVVASHLTVALTVAAMALAARSRLISPAKDHSAEQQSKDEAVVETGVVTGDGASCHPGNPDAAGSTTMSEAPAAEAPVPVAPSVDVGDSVNAQGEHVKTVLFKSFLIDKIYPSMKGPSRQQTLRLLPFGQSRYAWITASGFPTTFDDSSVRLSAMPATMQGASPRTIG
jgi:hypothetical protein